ncbi:MAG: 50S ribosomal protein L7/L12 [Candidatus Magasanikbacteria bacterium GW2011_GWA2_56_11]|uniref:50S ribosomal protein L7/L12 n=1 Tax=Candidatus Magasanikbacteria bacterium GW2011_GWA2_56_11 TaxID=1619044 RepID=A0A0G1YFH0_9BACT|nr:MAG: 50S ribosomal protein L7/L12 [Candidatus Magasanikbacteria bacterium GW2011_GWA2_56_11]
MDALATLLQDKEEQFKGHQPDSKRTDRAVAAAPPDSDLPSLPVAGLSDLFADDMPAAPPQQEAIRRGLYALKDQIDALLRLLDGGSPAPSRAPDYHETAAAGGERVIEGVFNGEKMVGPDGQEYHVPPNYASKSKLVEGDIMKLTITSSGSFIYKQIGPAARARVIGILEQNPDTRRWFAAVGSRRYKVLTASVSFYQGKSGDQIVLLVPENGASDWGAVENIIGN